MKRWHHYSFGGDPDEDEGGDWVLFEDHEREVAELKELVHIAGEQSYERENTILDREKDIEELKAALVNVRSALCWAMDRHELPMVLNDSLGEINKALGEK